MAIYHLSVKTTSRNNGESSVARAAYRAGSVLHDERTGTTYDYKVKSGIMHSVICYPAKRGVFKDIKNRADLWNFAEKTETRINSTVAREFEISLPDEFSEKQNIELARKFTAELVKRFGFCADLSIHKPVKRRKNSDKNSLNVHAHILCTTRNLLGKKTRELDERNSGAINEVRKLWENILNEHLAKNGFDQKVSCSSIPDNEKKSSIENIKKRIAENKSAIKKNISESKVLEEQIHGREPKERNSGYKNVDSITTERTSRICPSAESDKPIARRNSSGHRSSIRENRENVFRRSRSQRRYKNDSRQTDSIGRNARAALEIFNKLTTIKDGLEILQTQKNVEYIHEQGNRSIKKETTEIRTRQS